MSVTIKNQKFGVEIETAGASRDKLVAAVISVVGGQVTGTEAYLNATIVRDNQGRNWRLCNDSSIPIVNNQYGTEVVTPVLTYNDIYLLQNVVRALREAGAKTPSGTSVHIHVDAANHNADSIARLAKTMYKNEDLFYKAINFNTARTGYAGPMDSRFITTLASMTRLTDRALNEAWFGSYNQDPYHYDSHRYHGLNLNNHWRSINTIEFRYFQFNKGLHAGILKAWIQFVLAVSAKAINTNRASHTKTTTTNDKFTMRVWLKALDLIGDEFKTCRTHLLSNLTGDCAHRNSVSTSRVHNIQIQVGA